MSSVGTEARTKPRVALVAGGGAIKAYAFHVGVLRGLDEDGFRFRAGLRWGREDRATQRRGATPGAPTEPTAEANPPESSERPSVRRLGREVDTYVGSSAGACVLAGLCSGHAVEELGRAVLGTSTEVPTFGYRVMFAPVAPNPVSYARRLARRWQLGQLRVQHLLDVRGLVSAAGMERYFRRHVLPTNRFADLAANLFLVATQVNGSRKVVFGPIDSVGERGYDSECAYYDNVPVSEALAAAVSLPPLFAPYAIANPASGSVFHYFDGEVREPLSVHVARDVGAEFVIASSIWRPFGYEPRVGSLADFGMATVVEQALHQMIEQKVHQDRVRATQFDQLLALLERRGRDLGLTDDAISSLQAETCGLLHHRTVRALYVVPVASDTDFFFQGSFRFSRGLIEQCIDAGYRAYRAAAAAAPEFFEALDGQAAQAP